MFINIHLRLLHSFLMIINSGFIKIQLSILKNILLLIMVFPGIPGTMFRFDSLTGNLYCRSNTYCSYHPFEELVDSLTSRKGDSIIRCNTTPDKHYCLDTGSTTLLGTSVKTKVLLLITLRVMNRLLIVPVFGLSTYEAQDFGGIGIDQLIDVILVEYYMAILLI